jgi:uncharacterized protein
VPKENKLSESEISDLLIKAPVGNLALAMDNRPYVIPLNYDFHEGKIYFHCRLTGRKVDYIKANPRGCFQVSMVGELIASDSPCSHNYGYHSVIIEGVIEEIEEDEAKEKALRRITARYAGSGTAGAEITANRIRGVAVYCLEPETISGKKNS